MATYNYSTLKNTYHNFSKPEAMIFVNDKALTDDRGFPVGDLEVDLTSGFEASTAEFSIFEAYDLTQNEYLFDDVQNYILLGSKVDIRLGYGDKNNTKTVFLGVITRVNYLYEEEGFPVIRVTAMDVKGVMMSGSYQKTLTSAFYSDAVTEILQKTVYEKLQSMGVITKLAISKTSDKKTYGTNPSSVTETASITPMEMVADSDYDFVVKAAKRNNFEFFTECGTVYFREAKSDTSTLIELTPTMNMKSFDISYDITGLVQKVIVRGTDVSKAEQIKYESKLSNSISQGNKANNLIKGSQKVYIDPSIYSSDDAIKRAQSIAEQVSYRYGSMRCTFIGMPELQPGHFVYIYGLGTEPDNYFYVNHVRHTFDDQGRYLVTIEGITDDVNKSDPDSLLGNLFGDAISGALGGVTDSLNGLASDLGGISSSLSDIGSAGSALSSFF